MAMVYAFGEAIGMEPKDLIPNFRFGVPPALNPLVESGKALLNTPDKYGNERTLEEKATDVGKTLVPFIPAGVQGKKTIEGIGAYNQGASLTPTGRTRYEVEQTPGNLGRAAIFGQYSLPGAKEYFANIGKSQSEIIYNEFKKLKTTEEKSALWQQMVKEGRLTKDNVSSVKKWFEDEKLGITSKERKMRNLGVADGSRATMIAKEFDKKKTKEEKVALWQKYVEAGIITKEVAKQLKPLLK